MLPALLSSSVLAWNDGWTFDIASEFVKFGSSVYKVTGLGSYIAVATNEGQIAVAWFGVIVMGEIIFVTNQLIWHSLQNRVATHKPVLATILVPGNFESPLRLRRRFRRIFSFRLRQVGQTVRASGQISTGVLAAVFVATLLLVGVVAYANLPAAR